MLRKFLKIVLILLAVFVVLQIINAVIIYAMVCLNTQTGDSVKSPNGKYEAYIVTRGFMDSTDNRLHIKKSKAPARDVGEVWGTHISWSPDSRKVAIVDIEDGSGYDVQIYDVVNNLVGRCNFHISRKPNRKAGDDSQPNIVWEWDNSDTIIFAEDDQPENRKAAATINIKNTGKKLRVYMQK